MSVGKRRDARVPKRAASVYGRYGSPSWLWGQGVAGTSVVTLRHAVCRQAQGAGRHIEGLRNGHTTARKRTMRGRTQARGLQEVEDPRIDQEPLADMARERRAPSGDCSCGWLCHGAVCCSHQWLCHAPTVSVAQAGDDATAEGKRRCPQRTSPRQEVGPANGLKTKVSC